MKLEGKHKRTQKDFQVFSGLLEALHGTIVGAVAVEYQHIAALDQKYTGYSVQRYYTYCYCHDRAPTQKRSHNYQQGQGNIAEQTSSRQGSRK